MTGAKIGNWVVGPELGRGPHGVAYPATDDAGRPAVLKVLTLDATRTPEFLQRFPAEMLFLQRMNHPNVAKFYASGVHAGSAYYASEWVEGTDLGTLLRQPGRTADEPGLNAAADLVRVAVQATRALKHAHHRSILHRDLKPANVLVTSDGTVKLTDFGVAKVLNLPPLGSDPDPWGSAGFTAPELLTGKPFTKKSDLYALGCVLYAAATGRPPFAAGTAAEFLHKHCYTLPDRPSHVAPKLPPELDDIILGLMAKDPARRPPSAAAVLEQFDHLRGKLERKGVTVVWPPDPGDTAVTMPALRIAGEPDEEVEPVPRPLLSRPAVVAPLFLLVAGILVYGLFFGGGPDPESLYAAAQPLLASDDPADWDRAWDEYLDPLGRRHPELYAKEIAEARARINDRRELTRSVEQGAKFKPRSEAEAAYVRGLRLAQAGDFPGARRSWESVVAAFAGAEAEARWTKLAADGLAEVGKTPAAGTPTDARPGLVDAIGRAKKLQAAGDPAAPSVFDALDYLYRDDPKARELIRQAR
jgi:hypothetical protein